MATLTVQAISLSGVTPSYAACGAGGDEFANSGQEFIHVKNGSGGNLDVTINSQVNCSQGFDHDSVVTVTAGSEEIIGPFPKSRFDDANDKVQITYSGVTSLTIAVLQINPT